jgi:hypothetical protein
MCLDNTQVYAECKYREMFERYFITTKYIWVTSHVYPSEYNPAWFLQRISAWVDL